MKKIITTFLTLSIFIFSIVPSFALANDYKNIQRKSPQSTILVLAGKKDAKNVKEKKESIFSRAFTGLKNFVFKAQWTTLYYIAVTAGLISLFSRIGVFKSEEVYSELKNNDYKAILTSLLSNIKSIPNCANLIYNSDIEAGFCSAKDKEENSKPNSVEDLTCRILDSMRKFNDEDLSKSKKISSVLRNLSGEGQKSVKIWEYIKTHGLLLLASPVAGKLIGMLGTLVGAANLGWLYGILVIPYLWSFKDEKVGALEILANVIDSVDDTAETIQKKLSNIKKQVSDFLGSAKEQVAPFINVDNMFSCILFLIGCLEYKA
ncbi:MAG: hypothetical protein IJ758_02300 [Clostridia bacterium]|nr:hypothetical protein [Clostridia bacterium]